MNQDPLQQLKDIHLPAPSPWWDWAIGWWILLALAVAALWFVMPKLWRKWQTWRKQRMLQHTIHTEYQRICDAYARHQQTQQLAADINTLLRRVALTVFPKQSVAGLIGEDWLKFLDQVWQDKATSSFSEQPFADMLLHGAYQPDGVMSEQQAQALCDLVQAWLKEVLNKS
ncbi:DUF4381 domain-containing protein [Ghiorsea bivora]|uniref:DUF4381 domain-containing protein n=1 Tax=Ghiorsea bivora TaxID=1485545 RepID=UPI00068E7367|nr:DUF4381 domain-containing protein [Ghiorsea bivora]